MIADEKNKIFSLLLINFSPSKSFNRLIAFYFWTFFKWTNDEVVMGNDQNIFLVLFQNNKVIRVRIFLRKKQSLNFLDLIVVSYGNEIPWTIWRDDKNIVPNKLKFFNNIFHFSETSQLLKNFLLPIFIFLTLRQSKLNYQICTSSSVCVTLMVLGRDQHLLTYSALLESTLLTLME